MHVVKLITWLCLLACTLSCRAQFLQLKFDHITSENGLPHSTIHGIAKDKHGFMWFGTWSGLCRYDGYDIRVYRYDANDPHSIVNNRIHNVLLDGRGDIWISTFNEEYLCRYRYETDDFDRLPLDQCPPELRGKINRRDHRLQVNFTYKNTRWHLDNLSTALVETNLLSGKRKTYTVDSSNPWSINDAYVSDVFLDDQQVLWLGTYSNGINRSYLEATPFHYLYHYADRRNSLSENIIRSISEDLQGNLWVGTRSKGITLIKQDGTYNHYRHNPESDHSIQSDYIKKVFCDSKGHIWIGSQSGLDFVSARTERVRRINSPLLIGTGVFGIAEDAKTNLWLATWNGILKYDRRTGQIKSFDLGKALPEPHVWSILVDTKGQIWAGTEGGGISIFKEDEKGDLKLVRRLQHESATDNALSDNRIYSIFEDDEHHFWIGTGNGLDLYDPMTTKVIPLSQRSSLWPKGTIAGVTQDRNGFIWVSHKQGISRITKRTLAIRTFSKQDGLQSNEFADGAVYRSRLTHRLYFGGNRGVSYFSPDSIRTNPVAPRVVFTELRVLNEQVAVNQEVNGRVILRRPLYLTPSLRLTHEDKSISITFAALHFANPAGNKYAYMLEGFDKDWVYTDASKRIATYSNLAPGDYTFKVRASNSDGVWTTTPTALQIAVAPAPWASAGAYVIYALVFAGLLYAFYYYINRYTRLKSELAYEAILHEKERELHESKLQFFTNISHEIKTPLSLILSPIQQLKNWNRDDMRMQDQLQTMENNGNRLLRTVNQLLDIRRLETGHETLERTEIDLVSLVDKACSAFLQEAKRKAVNLKIASFAPTVLLAVDADKIEKVLYNLLSNAIKFTPPEGIIKIRISRPDNDVIIDVLDNGSSIPPEDLERIFRPFLQGKTTVSGGTGLGLTYSKSLIELHNGTLTAQSRSHATQFHLTRFRITLPTNFSDMRREATHVHKAANESFVSRFPPSSFPQPAFTLPRKCSLLLVEDNEDMRHYLASFFADTYTVFEAPNGDIGITMAKKHMPDIIISDVMMPKTDGISFTRMVKSDILLCHIPVILLTARTLLAYEVEGLETGADDYVVKPFHLPILSLKVRNLLLSRFSLQEKFKRKISVEPLEMSIRSPDEQLLQKVLAYVEEHIADSDLKIDKICQSIGLSRAQLYRKMKALTGYSMADLIKEVRLKRAQQLLRDKKFLISEVAYMVGFNDPEYFRKSFKGRYGYSPSEYAKQ